MPPNITGRYTLVSQENVDPYLQALDVNIALRKIASLLKPEKEIEQEGDHMIIRTLSTFRNYIMDFTLGVEFDEDMAVIDGRMVKTTVFWEGDKLVCVQKGEVKNRGWTQWLEGDLLHVELTAGNATAVQVFQKVK